jgi:hypothetical protein
MIGKYEVGDLKQGLVGDCWFLAGAAGVLLNEFLKSKVIPSGQICAGDGIGYTGINFFMFCCLIFLHLTLYRRISFSILGTWPMVFFFIFFFTKRINFFL